MYQYVGLCTKQMIDNLSISVLTKFEDDVSWQAYSNHIKYDKRN